MSKISDLVKDDVRTEMGKELILRYLASHGVDCVDLRTLCRLAPTLTYADIFDGAICIMQQSGTINQEPNNDGGIYETLWTLDKDVCKWDSPKFYDPVDKRLKNGCIIYEGEVFLALQ